MKESYVEKKNLLNQEIRIYERKKMKKEKLEKGINRDHTNPLEEDELKEEEYEYLEANLLCLGDDNKDSKYF